MHWRWLFVFATKVKNRLENKKGKNPYCLNVNRIMVAMITEYINKHPVVLMRLRLRLRMWLCGLYGFILLLQKFPTLATGLTVEGPTESWNQKSKINNEHMSYVCDVFYYIQHQPYRDDDKWGKIFLKNSPVFLCFLSTHTHTHVQKTFTTWKLKSIN